MKNYLSDPLNDGVSILELVDYAGNDFSITRSARVSFANDKEVFSQERDSKLINYLIKNRHWTPLEHTYINLHVACPMFVARQWMRHRTLSYNEVSRRYTSEDIQFYYPQEWRGQAHLNRQGSEGAVEDQFQITWRYEEHLKQALDHYEWMLHMGVSREQARMVLPLSTYTRFYVSGNLRNWLHFIDLRSEEYMDKDGEVKSHVQEEMKVYSDSIQEIIKVLFPEVFRAYKANQEERKR